MRWLLPALALLFLSVACSSDDSPSRTPSDDPEELAEQISDAWNDTGTFHASWESDDSDSGTTEADFASPELIGLSQTTLQDGEEYTYEAVLTRRGYLSRTCEEDECSGWAFFPWDYYGGGTFLGLGQEIPLELVHGIFDDLRQPSIVSSDEDGHIHIAAKFNVASIVLDSAIDFVEAHDLDFGNSCENQLGDSSIEIGAIGATVTRTPTPSPTPDCDDFTADDMRESNEPAVEHYDDSPHPIDIWVSPDTLLPERIRFSLPSNLPVPAGQPAGPFIDSDGREFDIHFSHYGDVTVDVPKIEIQ